MTITVQGSMTVIVEVAQPFHPQAIGSATAVGDVQISYFIPNYGDTSPTYLPVFNADGAHYTMPLSPAGHYLVASHLSSGTVDVVLPEPGVLVALALSLLVRRRKS